MRNWMGHVQGHKESPIDLLRTLSVILDQYVRHLSTAQYIQTLMSHIIDSLHRSIPSPTEHVDHCRPTQAPIICLALPNYSCNLYAMYGWSQHQTTSSHSACLIFLGVIHNDLPIISHLSPVFIAELPSLHASEKKAEIHLHARPNIFQLHVNLGHGQGKTRPAEKNGSHGP